MYSERIAHLKSSAIREILKLTAKPGVISFAGGLPAPELFPIKEVSEAAGKVFSKYGSASLQYSITEGLVPLRERVVSRMGVDGLGLNNVIITQGSQQALDLISKLFIDKGSVVFTENPSYLGALQSFQLFQADIRPIESDEEGMRTDALLRALDVVRPAFIYIMPNFQNPTGVSISLKRRRELVDVASQRNLIVVEDDPYGAIHFGAERLPTMFSLGGPKSFIYLSSFSKTVAPGLRVAYAVGEESVISKFAVVKQGTDLQTNTFGQYLINEYFDHGDFDSHLGMLRETYRIRRDCMLSAMDEYFPKTVCWNRPGGGMFLWVEFPEGWEAAEILKKCIERDVAFVPGGEFFPDGSGRNTARLNYSNASPENIREGIRRMGEVLGNL